MILRNLYFASPFQYAPDEGGSPGGDPSSASAGGAGVSDAGPAVSSSGASPAVPSAAGVGATASGPAASAPGNPAADGSAAGAPAGTPAPPAGSTPTQQAAWYKALADAGIDLGQDEQTALPALGNILRQFQTLYPYLASYQQHAPAFSRYLQESQQRQGQGQAPQQQAAPQQPGKPWDKYWKAPEFNPAWREYMVRGADGKVEWAPTTPPDVQAKYQAYAQFQKEQLDALTRNPFEYLDSYVTDRAAEIAQQVVAQQTGQQQQQQFANQVIQQNSNWLFEQDPRGGPRYDYQFDPNAGQMRPVPVLNAWGKRYQYYAQQEVENQRRYGYQDIQRQHQIAYAFTHRDMLQAQGGQGQAPAAAGFPAIPGQAPAAPQAPQQPATPAARRQAANNQFLQTNNPATPALPGTNGNARTGKPKITGQNLEQMLRAGFTAAGITDETLSNRR